MLREGQDFKKIKNSYVIFIYRHDKYKKGLPLYHIDRYVKETGEWFADGSHIIYVNGSYKGNDEIGRLMADFHQTNSEHMHYMTLAQSVKHYKETEEGRGQMCEAVEKYAKEYAINEKVISVQNLMENMKLTLEQALDAMGIQGDERTMIAERLQDQ